MILASASPRRQALLEQIGLTFQTVPSGAAEKGSEECKDPQELVLYNAAAKAKEVAARFPGEIVLGADTVVALDHEIFGKPRDFDEAKWMLKKLAGRRHQVHTGISFVQGGCCWSDLETTSVWFCDWTQQEIEQYIRTEKPLDKAGAYAVQGLASVYIKRIEGCYYNIVGLPLYRTMQLAKKAGLVLS